MPLGLVHGLAGFSEGGAVVGIEVKFAVKFGRAYSERPHHRLPPFPRLFELRHYFPYAEYLHSRRNSEVVVVEVVVVAIQRRRS